MESQVLEHNLIWMDDLVLWLFLSGLLPSGWMDPRDKNSKQKII
jgi:hypothetical protein